MSNEGSRIPGFYKLSVEERRQRLRLCADLGEEDLAVQVRALHLVVVAEPQPRDARPHERHRRGTPQPADADEEHAGLAPTAHSAASSGK